MTKTEMIAKANKSLEYYELRLVDKSLGEDGKWVEGKDVGYGLINKATGITEHTSVMLPGVLWQATHFESTLKSLLEEEEVAKTGPTGEDVVPFGPLN